MVRKHEGGREQLAYIPQARWLIPLCTTFYLHLRGIVFPFAPKSREKTTWFFLTTPMIPSMYYNRAAESKGENNSSHNNPRKHQSIQSWNSSCETSSPQAPTHAIVRCFACHLTSAPPPFPHGWKISTGSFPGEAGERKGKTVI